MQHIPEGFNHHFQTLFWTRVTASVLVPTNRNAQPSHQENQRLPLLSWFSSPSLTSPKGVFQLSPRCRFDGGVFLGGGVVYPVEQDITDHLPPPVVDDVQNKDQGNASLLSPERIGIPFLGTGESRNGIRLQVGRWPLGSQPTEIHLPEISVVHKKFQKRWTIGRTMKRSLVQHYVVPFREIPRVRFAFAEVEILYRRTIYRAVPQSGEVRVQLEVQAPPPLPQRKPRFHIEPQKQDKVY